MITVRKRLFTVGTPAVLGAILVAGTLSATELLSDDITTTDRNLPVSQSAKSDQPARAEKGNLKVELADVHGRPTRCVSGKGVTTCTGWPISNGMLAYAAE